MEEDKKQRGGSRPNAGRKSVEDEKKVNTLFVTALKEMYSVDSDDEAKIAFVKDTLMESQRGQIFIAEHIFGKPKETIESKVTIDNFNLKDVLKFKE